VFQVLVCKRGHLYRGAVRGRERGWLKHSLLQGGRILRAPDADVARVQERRPACPRGWVQEVDGGRCRSEVLDNIVRQDAWSSRGYAAAGERCGQDRKLRSVRGRPNVASVYIHAPDIARTTPRVLSGLSCWCV
jgi:hypothetical protein